MSISSLTCSSETGSSTEIGVPAFAILLAAAGALRGVGDTRVPMLLNLLGFWCIGLPVSALLGFSLGVGPQGVWWGLATGIGVVAILLLFRVRRRFGRSLRRLVIDDNDT